VATTQVPPEAALPVEEDASQAEVQVVSGS
jgi:hypothetical protein